MQTPTGFSPIFAFMDHADDVAVEYLRLHTASGDALTLTPDHIAWAHEPRRPVLAKDIKVGHVLWVAAADASTASAAAPAFSPSVVVRVEAIQKRGMHAPLTEDGSIVVDGVLASCSASARSMAYGETTLISGPLSGPF